LVLDAYQEAIKEKYRFYSYGDAMLILWTQTCRLTIQQTKRTLLLCIGRSN
jgi:hypothetical protein